MSGHLFSLRPPARLRPRLAAIVVSALPLLCPMAPLVHAVNVAWDGGGANNNWSTANNWSPNGVPATDDDISFGTGAARMTNLNDLPANTRLRSITFTEGDYILQGTNRLQLTSGIHSLSGFGGNTIQFPLLISTNQTFRRINVENELAIEGSVQLTNSAALTLQDATASGNIQLRGVISGTGSITKAGGGFAQLGASNTYSGDTVVNGGRLQITHSNGLGSLAAPTTVSGSGILQLAVPPGEPDLSVAESIDLNSGGTLRSVVGDHTVTGPVSSGSSTTFNVIEAFAAGSLTLAGPLTGNTVIRKSGSGTVALTGNNTFSNNMVVGAGVLRVVGPQAVGTTLSYEVQDGATLEFAATSFANPFSIPQTIRLLGDQTVRSRVANNTLGGVFNIAGSGTTSLSTDPGLFLTLGGQITGSSTDATLQLLNAARYRYSGTEDPNSFQGRTLVTCGTLELDKRAGLNAIAGDVTLAGACAPGIRPVLRLLADHQIADTAVISVSGLFDVAGRDERIQGLSGSGSVTLDRSGPGGSTIPGTLRVQGTALVPDFTGTITGTGTLIVDDLNGLGLEQEITTASPQFSGEIVVQNGGDISINGNISAARVIVNGGQFGGGDEGGVTTGPITALAGELFTGDGITANGGVNFGPGSSIFFQNIFESNPGPLRVIGSVQLQNPELELDNDGDQTVNQVVLLIENDGSDSVAGQFRDFPEAAINEANGILGRITYQGGTGNDVAFTSLQKRCAGGRPPVHVETRKINASLVETTVTATTNGVQPSNQLVLLKFVPRTGANARVTVPVQPGVPTQVSSTGVFDLPINLPQPTIRFTVQQVNTGASATASFTAYDRCNGGWESLGGAGRGVYGVGSFSADQSATTLAPGETANIGIHWSVPPSRTWHDLAAVRVRVSDPQGATLLVRWDESTNAFATERTAAPASFELGAASAQGSGPAGESVSLRIPIRALPDAMGRTFTLEVEGSDDLGAIQEFETAGSLTVATVSSQGVVPPASAALPPQGASLPAPAAIPATIKSGPEPAPRRVTPEQRQQRRRTDTSSLDDTQTEGSILHTDCASQPPIATLGGMDGSVVLRLHADAASICRSLAPGVYVLAEGEKIHELLYEIESIDLD